MKTLLLMRHAKSSWNNPGLSDHDRPLNARGRRAAPRMGRLLADEGLVPDVIVSSTAERARLTTAGVLEACPFEGDVIYTRDLYHAGVEDMLEILVGIDTKKECVMMVGHNPGMEYFLEEICGEIEHMPTAAIALIQFVIEEWSELSDESEGELLNFWRPKELD